MTDQLISFETAKLAKEKGFEQFLSTHIYEDKGDLIYWTELTDQSYITAPTQSLLQKWLREVHNIQVYVVSNTKNGNGKYRDYVVHINGISINDARDEEFQTYEDALEAGLQEALKLLL